MMFCSKCGKEINDNSTFCPSCGNQLVYNGGQLLPPKPLKKTFSRTKAGAIINIVGFGLAVPFYLWLISTDITPPTVAANKFYQFAYILIPLWICAVSIFVMRKDNSKLIKILSIVNMVLAVSMVLVLIGGFISISSTVVKIEMVVICCFGGLVVIPSILQAVGSLISLIGAFAHEKVNQ